MPKKYFIPRNKKKEPNLFRIVALILVVAALGYGAFHWFTHRRNTAENGSTESAQTALPSADASAAQNSPALDGVPSSAAQLPAPAAPAEPAAAPQAAAAVDVPPSDPAVRDALLQAQAARAAGKLDEALELLRQAKEQFASRPDAPIVAARYARILAESGKASEAAVLFDEIRNTAPPGMRSEALYGLGMIREQADDLVGACALYEEAFRDAPCNTPSWNEAVDALGKTKAALIFSPAQTADSKVYELQKGDNLTSIGIKLNTTQGLLTRANGITEQTTLQLGQRLKYTPKDFRILIERSTCRLFLLDNEGLFKRYYVGLGMPGYETTLGKYTIGNKEKEPVWHKKGAAPVPSGDPANELGTRWMPLVPTTEGLPRDLGIHGTIAPETIGQYKSHGCPRMRKEDVEELYDLVVRSTPVEIVETIAPAQLL